MQKGGERKLAPSPTRHGHFMPTQCWFRRTLAVFFFASDSLRRQVFMLLYCNGLMVYGLVASYGDLFCSSHATIGQVPAESLL